MSERDKSARLDMLQLSYACTVHALLYIHEQLYIDRALFTCTVPYFIHVISYMWFTCEFERWLSIKLLKPHIQII